MQNRVHPIPMKTTAAQSIALALSCAFAACSTVTVTTDYDHSAPFGKYNTYTLAPAARDQTLSPAGEAALRNSLRTHLAARGINEAPHAKAHLDVVRHV